MKLLQLFLAVLVSFWACCVVEADAASTVIVTQTSEGVYSVSVANVVKASALDFTIKYDVDTLSNPVISNGPAASIAGVMQIPNNDSKLGVLRVVYLAAAKDVFFDGSGLFATVTFTKIGNKSSRLPEIKSEIFSDSGTRMVVQSIVTPLAGTDAALISTGNIAGTNAGSVLANAAANNTSNAMTNNVSGPSAITNTAIQTSPSTGVMGNLPGSPSMSKTVATTTVNYQTATLNSEQASKFKRDEITSDSQVQSYQQNQNRGSEAVKDAVSSAGDDNTKMVVPDAKPAAKLVNFKPLQSVAERFRTYSGPRTLKNFAELFYKVDSKVTGFAQHPKIAVSDGRQKVTVKITLAPGSGVPAFSMKGANLKGLKSVSDKLLELDVIPQKGKHDIRISMKIQKKIVEIPLLVVPPISLNIIELSDKVLEKMLFKPDAKNKPLPYDLNVDGKQDYLDDYILVAHWLLKQQTNKKTPATKVSAPR